VGDFAEKSIYLPSLPDRWRLIARIVPAKAS
jgi:hypothetical protein